MAEVAPLLGKSVSSSSFFFYIIMTNDAKHMCQGNEMNVFVGKFKSFFLFSEKKSLGFVRKEKKKRDQRGGFLYW